MNRTVRLTAAIGVLAMFFNSVGAAAELRSPPWHLIDIWWNLGEDRPFESYAIDVEIADDPPAEALLYVAPVGIAHLNGTPFYGGLQTLSDGYTREDRRLRKLGPGLLMSMWNERSEEAIRPSQGGFFQSSGHEGDFVSVRRPYRWKRGKYTYRVVRMDGQMVDGQPYTWVGAFVHCHAKNEHVFIGALRFPGEELVLGKGVASFVEIYGPPIPVERIPHNTITFGNLRVNGRPVDEPRAVAVYPAAVPDRAEAVAKDGRIVVRVGAAVERTQRRVPLLPAE
jgi:hypothetical protein